MSATATKKCLLNLNLPSEYIFSVKELTAKSAQKLQFVLDNIHCNLFDWIYYYF